VIAIKRIDILRALEKQFIPVTAGIVIVLICGGMLYMHLYPASSNPNARGSVVEPVKWDENTYYFAAAGPSWPVSKKAFFDKHPELKFVGASPDNTGQHGTQLGTWLYVKPKQ